MAAPPDPNEPPNIVPTHGQLAQRVNAYLGDLISAFTGGEIDSAHYAELRSDLLNNEAYNGLAPSFLKRARDSGALWSFAKSVDPSWEPRRQFLRNEFEPLLEYLETGGGEPVRQLPGVYDSSAWTGVTGAGQKIKAIRTMVPVSLSAIEVLLSYLEAPSHNGGPPLDEVTEAIKNLRSLHRALGEMLSAASEGGLERISPGAFDEVSHYAKRAAKCLKDDPMPYAMSATILAVLNACGFPGIAGYLAGLALAVRKPSQE